MEPTQRDHQELFLRDQIRLVRAPWHQEIFGLRKSRECIQSESTSIKVLIYVLMYWYWNHALNWQIDLKDHQWIHISSCFLHPLGARTVCGSLLDSVHWRIGLLLNQDWNPCGWPQRNTDTHTWTYQQRLKNPIDYPIGTPVGFNLSWYISDQNIY